MACAIVFATQHDILISKHVLQKRLIYKVKKHLSTKASNHWDSLVVGIFQLPEPPTVWNRNLLTVEPLLFRILWTVVLSSKAAHISTSFDCNHRCIINGGFCTMHKIFWNMIRKLRFALPSQEKAFSYWFKPETFLGYWPAFPPRSLSCYACHRPVNLNAGSVKSIFFDLFWLMVTSVTRSLTENRSGYSSQHTQQTQMDCIFL